MIALLMTIYMFGALGMGAFVLVLASVGALFGSLPNSAYFVALGYAALWPVVLVYWACYWGYLKVIKPKRKMNGFQNTT